MRPKMGGCIIYACFLCAIGVAHGYYVTQYQQKCGLDFKWSCGATDSPFTLSLTEQMACSVATPLCPRTLNAINNCCVQHDQCYSQKLGQFYCDEVFCQCLCVTKWDGPVCAMKVGCGFCVAVRLFGAIAYNSGGHK